MSFPITESARRAFAGNLGVAQYTVDTLERSEDLRIEHAEKAYALFLRLGRMYGWTTCPPEEPLLPGIQPCERC